MIKRIIDLVLAGVLSILFSPLLIAVFVLVRAKDGKPVIYKHRRPGLHGKLFTIYKFRTMTDQRDENGVSLPDLRRLTPLGRILRSFSLDEWPELFNVIRGDMSLVGPRPLLKEYINRYTAEQSRRHEVRPGITGWAQIHGRNNLKFSQRLALDVWYVDNRSLWLDLKILAITALKVVLRDGARTDQVVSEIDDIGLYPDSMPEKKAAAN
jgi:sugar transferase EpsL